MTSTSPMMRADRNAQRLAALKAAAEKYRAAKQAFDTEVRAATALGAHGALTWEQVGEVLGLSRSAAHGRYNPRPTPKKPLQSARRGGAGSTVEPRQRPTAVRASRR